MHVLSLLQLTEVGQISSVKWCYQFNHTTNVQLSTLENLFTKAEIMHKKHDSTVYH